MDQQGGVSGGAMTYHSPSYYVRMAMSSLRFGDYDGVPLYERIYEFVISYVSSNGKRRGAFAAAAQTFYPRMYKVNPRYAVKLAYEMFRYALKKRIFGTNVSGTSGTNDFGTNGLDVTMESPEQYDLGYIVSQSRPLVSRNRFREDMELPRSVFEFKKLAIAIVREVYSGKLASRAVDLVHTLCSDKRVVERLKGKRIWYNSKSYVRLDSEAAALLYTILLKIHMKLYGLSQRPRKLIAVFTTYTGYTLEDLEKELKELAREFYDWFILLS